MVNNLSVADLVHQRRTILGLSQRVLAYKTGISQGYVNLIENEKRIPSSVVGRRLARALGLAPDEVLKATGHWPRSAPLELEPDELVVLKMYRETTPDLREIALASLRLAWWRSRENTFSISERLNHVIPTAETYLLYEQFAAELEELVGFDRLTINVVDPESQMFSPAYIAGAQIKERSVGMILPLEGTVTEMVVNSGQVYLNTDGVNQITSKDFHSNIAAPLDFRDPITTTIHLQAKEPGTYQKIDTAKIEQYLISR